MKLREAANEKKTLDPAEHLINSSAPNVYLYYIICWTVYH